MQLERVFTILIIIIRLTGGNHKPAELPNTRLFTILIIIIQLTSGNHKPAELPNTRLFTVLIIIIQLTSGNHTPTELPNTKLFTILIIIIQLTGGNHTPTELPNHPQSKPWRNWREINESRNLREEPNTIVQYIRESWYVRDGPLVTFTSHTRLLLQYS